MDAPRGQVLDAVQASRKAASSSPGGLGRRSLRLRGWRPRASPAAVGGRAGISGGLADLAEDSPAGGGSRRHDGARTAGSSLRGRSRGEARGVHPADEPGAPTARPTHRLPGRAGVGAISAAGLVGSLTRPKGGYQPRPFRAPPGYFRQGMKASRRSTPARLRRRRAGFVRKRRSRNPPRPANETMPDQPLAPRPSGPSAIADRPEIQMLSRCGGFE